MEGKDLKSYACQNPTDALYCSSSGYHLLSHDRPQASKLSKEYEKEGGGYENVAGSKNEPAKGPPEAKSEAIKKEEVKTDNQEKDTKEKPKANSAKKATGKKGDSKTKAPKEKKELATGTRKSTRIGTKRSAPDEETEPQEKDVKEKAPAKKAKTAKK